MAITAPSNLTATPTSAADNEVVTFRWSAASGASFSRYLLRGFQPDSTTPGFVQYVDSSNLSTTIDFFSDDDVPVGSYMTFSVIAEGYMESPSNSVRVYKAAPNSAPTTPGFINVTPLSGRAGDLITITWGEASDADGNLLRYELELSVDGGEWYTIFRGDLLFDKILISENYQNTLQFRVKAVDADGEESSYVVSKIVTIMADIFPDGGRLELFENEKAEPVFPVTVLDGVFRRSDKKPLSAILNDAGAVAGPAGPGVPAGGAKNQILAKKSASDYDTAWVNPPNGGEGAVSGVASFNGRTGAVTPQKGDYSASDVGAIASGAVQTVQVLTQTEYDALSAKSGSTLYLIKE